MLESISIKNIQEVHDLLRQKLMPYSSDLLKEISGKDSISFNDLIEVFQSLQIELSEKENNYLVFIMKEKANSIYELKFDNLRQIIKNQQLTSEDLRSNRIVTSYRQANQDHLYFIEQDFGQLLMKYNLDSGSIHSSRASSLTDKLSKYLSERLMSFPEFISNEVFYIKIGNPSNSVTIPVFHINSLLKLMLKNGIVPELFKKEVYILWVTFKVNLNRMTSDRNLIDALNESNVQLSPYIDMKLFEESLKLPKYSEDDKIFFLKLNDYLSTNEISFEAFEFMLQLTLDLFPQQRICNELIERNSNLIQFAHLPYIHVIRDEDFLKFYQKKILKDSTHIPNMLLIEAERKNIKQSSTSLVEIKEVVKYLNLTFLREKLISLKFVLANSQLITKINIPQSARSLENEINAQIEQALATRENDRGQDFRITETNKFKTDLNNEGMIMESAEMRFRIENAGQFNSDLLEQVSSCQLQILKTAVPISNSKQAKLNSSYLEDIEGHEPRVSKCNMFMIDESKANDFENYGFNDKSYHDHLSNYNPRLSEFKQTPFRGEIDEHFNDFSLCNAFIDRIIEENIQSKSNIIINFK